MTTAGDAGRVLCHEGDRELLAVDDSSWRRSDRHVPGRPMAAAYDRIRPDPSVVSPESADFWFAAACALGTPGSGTAPSARAKKSPTDVAAVPKSSNPCLAERARAPSRRNGGSPDLASVARCSPWPLRGGQSPVDYQIYRRHSWVNSAPLGRARRVGLDAGDVAGSLARAVGAVPLIG